MSLRFIYIYIYTPDVTASFVIEQFILSTLSDNPCYYFTFWGPFIVAISYVIPHLQPTYRNHQSWQGKYPYIHTYIYMNGELFITVDYMRSQVTWHTCLHAELMHLKINTKIWNMPCHAFVVSPRWTIVNRGRCSHPIVITFRCWMCRWKGCIRIIFGK